MEASLPEPSHLANWQPPWDSQVSQLRRAGLEKEQAGMGVEAWDQVKRT
jgi:hypothetical protein